MCSHHSPLHRVGSTRQPPCATCSASPLIGRREGALRLLCASASSGEPSSEVAWLWTARCHGNCILHPSRRLHLRAIGENRGTREIGKGEKTVAWLHSLSFLAQSSLHSILHRERQLPKPVSRPLEWQPLPKPSPVGPAPHHLGALGPPCWREAWS